VGTLCCRPRRGPSEVMTGNRKEEIMENEEGITEFELLQMLNHPDRRVRMIAALSEYATEMVIMKALVDKDPMVRLAARANFHAMEGE
jgi:hypothetical protein